MKYPALFVFVFLGACGGGDRGNSIGVDAPGDTADADAITEADLPLREAEARCARLFGCCTPTELIGTDYNSEVECVAEIAGWLSSVQQIFDERIVAGTVVYRPDLAGACVARVNALTCDAVSMQRFDLAAPLGISCIEAFQGLATDGQACADSIDCASRFCIATPLAGAGTCGQPPGLGQPCHGGCTGDLVCVGSNATTAGTCMMKHGVGGVCAITPDCQAGLVCVLPAGECQVDDDPVCDGL
jgi:hypothetical protein